MSWILFISHREFSFLNRKFCTFHCSKSIIQFSNIFSSLEPSSPIQNQLLQPLPLSKFNRHFESTSQNDGLLKRMIKKLKFNLFTTQELNKHACYLYPKVEENIDINKFFKVCQMPDTFFSWYRVTELHMWMLCVRCMAAGEEGIIVRNSIMTSFYEELDQRSRQLEAAIASIRKKQVTEIAHHFRYSLICYDRTLDGDDKKLASELWCTLFDSKEDPDPRSIECCVSYVRKNLAHLDSIQFGEMLLNHKISFLPLQEPDEISIC